MAYRPISFKLEYRDLALILLLFFLVASLLFTVGLLTGKGLAQSKYERLLASTLEFSGTSACQADGKLPSEKPIGSLLPPPAQEKVVVSTDEVGPSLPLEEPAITSVRRPLVAPPPSFPAGKFAVQVGSYPTEQDALSRVETLRKLGFPHAYFSAKALGDQKETWFRVWLGHFHDLESAKKSGELLQQRGEVKNYLIRKTDQPG